MEYHKNLMKISLAENLRELMVKRLFEKITIKQICDETGVIRATFYNYFSDKYDCLNWIVYHDIVENAKDFVASGEFEKALTDSLNTLLENKQFYRIAYHVTGQNSFEDMIRDNLRILVMQFLERYRKDDYLSQYSNELLSRYYAESLAFNIRMFVNDIGGERSVEETKQMTLDLMKNSFFDFVKLKEVKD